MNFSLVAYLLNFSPTCRSFSFGCNLCVIKIFLFLSIIFTLFVSNEETDQSDDRHNANKDPQGHHAVFGGGKTLRSLHQIAVGFLLLRLHELKISSELLIGFFLGSGAISLVYFVESFCLSNLSFQVINVVLSLGKLQIVLFSADLEFGGAVSHGFAGKISTLLQEVGRDVSLKTFNSRNRQSISFDSIFIFFSDVSLVDCSPSGFLFSQLITK